MNKKNEVMKLLNNKPSLVLQMTDYNCCKSFGLIPLLPYVAIVVFKCKYPLYVNIRVLKKLYTILILTYLSVVLMYLAVIVFF